MSLSRKALLVALMAGIAWVGALATGCNDLTGCEERTRIVEIEWGAIGQGIQELLLENYQEAGWDCSSEPLRNALRAQIGERWTCRICD